MTTPEGGLEAAWSEWSRALVSTLFPGGLGPGQHFAFGQTTLMADFANADPQVANAEIFRIGDTVPAAAPNFVPQASLSDAYGFFLQRIESPALAMAQANMAAANSAAQTGFNMPAKVGTQSPAGYLPPGQGGTAQALQAMFLPAYELDTGFRTRYQEWQSLSARGQTRAGGVISFSSRIGDPPGSSPSMHALMPPSVSTLAAQPSPDPAVAPQVPTPPAFFRVVVAAPAPLQSAFAVDTAQPPALPPSSAQAAVEHYRPVALAANRGSSNFSLEVSFTGLGTFMIGPARWFSDTAVRLFADQLSPTDKALFFAAGGVLARRIYQVVIAFEPTVILRFDDREVFKNAKTLLSDPQGDSVSIGPLNFDSKLIASASSKGAVYSDDVQTITIGPVPSTLPILLGVVSTDVATFPPAP